MQRLKKKESKGGSRNASVMKTIMQSMLVTKMNAVVAESRIHSPESLFEASRQNLETKKAAKFTSHENKVHLSEHPQSNMNIIRKLDHGLMLLTRQDFLKLRFSLL
jgi:hypothetical protein